MVVCPWMETVPPSPAVRDFMAKCPSRKTSPAGRTLKARIVGAPTSVPITVK